MTSQPAIRNLLGMGRTGTTGGDMFMSGMIRQGGAAWGEILSGKLDPLQQAINYSNVNKAADGLSFAGKQAILALSPIAMASILSGGELPRSLTIHGVTREDVKKYQEESINSQFARAIPALFEGGDGRGGKAADTLKGLRSVGGNYQKYLEGTGKKGKALLSEVESLAGVLSSANGRTFEQEYGTLIRQLGTEPGRWGFETGTGKGAHAAGLSKRVKANLAAKAGLETNQLNRDAKGEAAALETAADAPKVEERLANRHASLQAEGGTGGMGDFSANMAIYTDKLGDYTTKLEELVQIMSNR
jgi:hypothetical protein